MAMIGVGGWMDGWMDGWGKGEGQDQWTKTIFSLEILFSLHSRFNGRYHIIDELFILSYNYILIVAFDFRKHGSTHPKQEKND